MQQEIHGKRRRWCRDPSHTRLTVTVVGCLVVVAACGSQHSSADLRAAAGEGPSASIVNPDAEAHSTAPGTDSPEASDSSVAASAPLDESAGQRGSLGSEDSPDSTAAPGDATPIRLGNVGVYSGLGGRISRTPLAALRAWEQSVNARGGIAGHPVELLVADDGGDPAQSREARRRLIDEEGVVAFVGNMDPLTGPSFVQFHDSAGIPIVGGMGGAHYYESPIYFPATTVPPAQFTAMMAAAADLAPEITEVATIACIENRQTCGDAAAAWAREAGDFGQTVVYRAQVSIAQPDFTGECLGARNAGARLIYLAVDAAASDRFAASCERQGYRPRYVMTFAKGYLASEGALEGAIFASPAFPWISTAGSRSAYSEAMSAFAPDVDPADGIATQIWASGVLLERAIELAAPAGKVSSRDVLRGLWRMQDETLGGLTYPLSFEEGKPARPRVCFFAMSIAGGSWTAPSGDDAQCR